MRGFGESGSPAGKSAAVQGLVYTFVVIAGLGVAAAAYFGFSFTPIEAFVTGLCFVAIAVVMLERTLRRRAEARLEKGIDDLARLLSTDAQAGAVLGQRINALVDQHPGQRLDGVEADISVLGTVVRQVAEAVAELEEARRRDGRKLEEIAAMRLPAPAAAAPASVAPPPPPPEPDPDHVVAAAPVLPPAPVAEPEPPGPAIPLERVRRAIDDNRLLFHIRPLFTLPQRRAQGYDLVPRLMLEDGALADPPDFMPPRGAGDNVTRRIERLALEEAVSVTRRVRALGPPMALIVPVSRSTLVDAPAIERNVALFEANRSAAASLVLRLRETDWSQMPLSEKAALAAFVKHGLRLSLIEATTLRLDYAALAAAGIAWVRFDATAFVTSPDRFTDFHSADVAAYAKRFGVELVAEGVVDEQQVLTLLEDGIPLAMGPHLAGPGPVRPELLIDRRQAEPRRAEA